MAHVKRGTTTHARHKKILKLAKGYRGRSKSCYRIAVQRVEKALQYAYRDRRNRKRDFRGLWIQRINAGARLYGLTYSQLIYGLQKLQETQLGPLSSQPVLDRKILSDMVVNDLPTFANLVSQIKT